MAVTPAVSACRLLCSVLLGGVLGILFGFLKAPGRRHRHPADLAFSLAAVWVWLYHSFAVCRGDIRVVYLFGLTGGLLVWEKTFGVWLSPVFDLFWKFFAAVWLGILFPLKKILIFEKILFASAEKWVTIVCTKLFKSGQKRREESHGRKKHPAQECESGSSSRIQYP